MVEGRGTEGMVAGVVTGGEVVVGEEEGVEGVAVVVGELLDHSIRFYHFGRGMYLSPWRPRRRQRRKSIYGCGTAPHLHEHQSLEVAIKFFQPTVTTHRDTAFRRL